MKDTIFIQFVRPAGIFYKKRNIVSNGFSHVFDWCKNNGDFYWAKDISPKPKEDIFLSNKLPIEQGKAYVSAFFTTHVIQTLYWGEMYPNIEFILGGPAVLFAKGAFYGLNTIPKNIHINESILEEEVGSSRWNIEPPDWLKGSSIVSYLYDRHCYWGKCIFCNKKEHNDPKYVGKFNSMKSLVLPKYDNIQWKIFIVSSSVTPDIIRNDIIPFIRENDVPLDLFLRADWVTVNSLSNLASQLQEKEIIFRIGLEVPSDRMLKIIRKGITQDTILKTVKILMDYKQHFSFFFIVGWNSLEESDVSEIESLLIRIRDITGDFIPSCSISFLGIGCGDELNNEIIEADGIKDYDTINYGTLKYKWILTVPKLTEEKMELNRKLRSLYYKYLDVRADYTKPFLGRI